MEFMLVWTDLLQLTFVLLAYLAAAAFGAAAVRAGYLGKTGGGVLVSLNLALVVVVAASIILAGTGSVIAAWTAFILTAPFMVFVLPYFLGTALVRGRALERRAAREGFIPKEAA